MSTNNPALVGSEHPLARAFAEFEQASGVLERSYAELAVRLSRLDRQLADSNRRLARSLAEKDRVARCLDALIENLACGVLVVGGSGEVMVRNREAERLTGGGEADDLGDRFFEDLAARALAPGAPASGHTHRQVRLGDGDALEVDLSFAPLPAETADEPALVVILSDVTGPRRAREREERRERLEGLGRLVAEIAHEIRNPLGSLEIFAGLLLQEVSDRPKARELVELVLGGLRQLDGVVSGMLAFSGGRPVRPRPTDLAEVVRETARYGLPIARARGVTLEADADEPIDAAVDPGQLQQALLNLLHNALDASAEGELVRIAARRGDDGRARVLVEDHGEGIPPEATAKIFDPFFSLKERGTGLGLSVALGIVEAHGGSLALDPRPDGGTCATVSLPTCIPEESS